MPGTMFQPPPRPIQKGDGIQVGKVQTVLGTINPEELGVTLMHEHLLSDTESNRRPPVQASATTLDLFYKPVSPEVLGYRRHYGATNADNDKLIDISVSIEEAMLYKEYGGDTLVDVTSIGIARDPMGLYRISRVTGLNIIMGSSHYVAASHPPDMDDRSEEAITAQIVRDVTEGADGTGIRSGIIGEVGCTSPLRDNERKVLRASARAQSLTGAPLTIHPGRDEENPFEIVEVLSEAGADLNRTIMGHLDRTIYQHSNLKRLAETGCYLEWDMFGREWSFYRQNPDADIINDATRMDDIAWIISEGYGDKVVLSHDIAHKHRLLRYGGTGYFYILAHIVPRMLRRGFTEESVHKLLVTNPQAALTFVEPQKA